MRRCLILEENNLRTCFNGSTILQPLDLEVRITNGLQAGLEVGIAALPSRGVLELCLEYGGSSSLRNFLSSSLLHLEPAAKSLHK